MAVASELKSKLLPVGGAQRACIFRYPLLCWRTASVGFSLLSTLQSLKSPAGRKSQNSRLANFFPGKIPILINNTLQIIINLQNICFTTFFAGTHVISLALPTAASLLINCSLRITHSPVVLVISNRSSTLYHCRCEKSFTPPPY